MTFIPIKVFTFILLTFNLLALSLDRLITVKWSLWYQSQVEHKRLVFTSIAIYLLAIIASVLAYLSKTFNKKNHYSSLREAFSTITTISTLTVLCVTNSILHRVTKKQIIKIKINSTDPNGYHIKHTQKKSNKICFGTTFFFCYNVEPKNSWHSSKSKAPKHLFERNFPQHITFVYVFIFNCAGYNLCCNQ